MITDAKLNTIKSTILIINKGLKIMGVELKIVINKETVTIYHTYARTECINMQRPSYTFPLSMLI